MGETRMSALSPARREFVLLLHSIQFGQIGDLRVRDGEPLASPPPRITRSVRLGGEESLATASKTGDFALKRHLVELFACFDQVGTGTISRIDVRGGLPSFLTIEEPTSPQPRTGR